MFKEIPDINQDYIWSVKLFIHLFIIWLCCWLFWTSRLILQLSVLNFSFSFTILSYYLNWWNIWPLNVLFERFKGLGPPSLCVCPKWLCNCKAAGRGPLLCRDESSTASILTPWSHFSFCLFHPPSFSFCLPLNFRPFLCPILPVSLTHKHSHMHADRTDTFLSVVNSLMSGPAGRWTHAGLGQVC